ncbi:chiasma assembly [Rhizoctonia solani]|uniref:Chiasma assembly n=2 Tax=Rhizoctonia solani TaxID=456999 RepID=A0A8H7M816_9AGAM|nr:chiasma assembly [Rhizoctonia solani]
MCYSYSFSGDLSSFYESVLSGLSPSVILEISSRAIAFWQYQIHQESSFQAAILKNLNERNAHLQKQLDNVVREANSELSLLNNKLTSVERDLETERRKCRDLAESTREKDKEYQKLKSQYDVLKRKTILAPDTLATAAANEAAHQLAMNRTASPAEQQGAGGLRDIAGGMNANRPTRAFSSASAGTGIPRRSVIGTGNRAFQPNRTLSASISGSDTDHGERRSVFQSVAAGPFAKARNAPRVIAQPTPARTGPGGLDPPDPVRACDTKLNGKDYSPILIALDSQKENETRGVPILLYVHNRSKNLSLKRKRAWKKRKKRVETSNKNEVKRKREVKCLNEAY